MAFEIRNICGWKPDPGGAQRFAQRVGTLGQVASNLIGGEQKNVYLWQPLLKCKPTWRRGSQGIGDCVSFGSELACTLLMATDAVTGIGEWIEEAATESIYGGARVEAMNKQRGGRQDGATGYGAAQWVSEKFGGVLLRIDYSKQTANKEHDLRKYDPKKAKEWGDYGCGGANDKGKLDGLAKLHPVQNVAQVTKVAEAIAALTNWYPITIASMAGFGSMKRDANGLCRWVDEWAHQMCLIAIRWRNGKPEFRVGQSWGDSCSGPDPGIEETLKVGGVQYGRSSSGLLLPSEARSVQEFRQRLILPSSDFQYHADYEAEWNPISACSWWIDEATLARILQTGDCWTYSGVKGFEPRKLDVTKAILDGIRS